MKHPHEADLALFTGHDLGLISEWRISRHVAQCEKCRAVVADFESTRLEVATLGELPPNIGWNRLASEMKANIRVGLEAGECVAGPFESDKSSPIPVFTGWHTLLAYAGLIALVVAGVWLQRPAPPVDLGEVAVTPENPGAVLAANDDGIQLTKGGRGLSLRYGSFRGDTMNYSADASGAMGARYVDSSTGYVTVVNVNVE